MKRCLLSLVLLPLVLVTGCSVDGLSSQETMCRTGGAPGSMESSVETDDHGKYLAGMSVAAIEAGVFLMGSEEGHPHRHDD